MSKLLVLLLELPFSLMLRFWSLFNYNHIWKPVGFQLKFVNLCDIEVFKIIAEHCVIVAYGFAKMTINPE